MVLSTLSKIVERTAQTQLLNFFEDQNLLNPSNHAYRKLHSTTTTLLEIMDEVYQGTEENKFIQIMALDQTSAFDCVSHELLLQKLEKYKIGRNARNWIQDYLSNRTHYVVIGSAESRMVPIISGVPQGSVIGPLLYAIYTNELTEIVKSDTCPDTSHLDRSQLFGRQCSVCGILTIYADDTTYTVTNKSRTTNQAKINRCLDEISLLLQDNFLVLNQPKTAITECMIGQKRGENPGPPPSLLVTKSPGVTKLILDSKYTRILGGNIQNNLGWSAHLEGGEKALLPGVRKQLGHLKHIGKLIPLDSRLNLANGLLVSRINYLMPLWGAAPLNLINKVQTVMNEAGRWATGSPRCTRNTELLEKTGWNTVRELIEIATATHFWKLVHQGKPTRLLERMTIQENLDILVDNPRLMNTRQGFRWKGSKEWNNLPREMREINSISLFKKTLKKFIRSQRLVRNPTQPPD